MKCHDVLIVFAKPQITGRVKTRLIGLLTPAEAAEVHFSCFRDTTSFAGQIKNVKRYLYIASSLARARELGRRLKLAKKWRLDVQRGKDLGIRMETAIREQLSRGERKVLIIGTDTPWMDGKRIEDALRALDAADVVIGPCDDGGYYLIGTRRLVPEMFRGIRWGTSEVLPRTLAALRKAHVRVRLLKKDFDLDRPADFHRAMNMLRRNKRYSAPALAHWIEEWEKLSESSHRRQRCRRNRIQRPGRG